MTSSSRVGGRRSISFPIMSPESTKTLTRHESTNPLVIFRTLLGDNHVIGEKLQSLGLDHAGVHGDLQVILSALRRMQKAVQSLIALEEGDPISKSEEPQS